MPHFRTHYDNLKIARHNASDTIIRAAYKSLIQKYHPDKFDGPAQEALRITKIVNHSYEILIHPDKRAKHDLWINEQEAKLKKKFGNIEFGGITTTQYFYNQSHDQNFYTEKELYGIAASELALKIKKQGVREKDHRIYYSGLMIAAAIVLLFIGVLYHSSILMTVSVMLLFIQPVYITYVFASRFINAFYEQR
jgi:curved DNA-binding protein CbpA